jgi:hypothetical protein
LRNPAGLAFAALLSSSVLPAFLESELASASFTDMASRSQYYCMLFQVCASRGRAGEADQCTVVG